MQPGRAPGFIPARPLTDGILRSTRLPTRFDALWNSFPNDKNAENVKRLVGGRAGASPTASLSAIRMSRSLNYAGYPIPQTYRLKQRALSTLSGADKLWYAYKDDELKEYIQELFGPPSIVVSSKAQTTGASREPFLGKKGIIAFDMTSGSDATGHLDLWDGNAPRHAESFDKALKVSLWELA